MELIPLIHNITLLISLSLVHSLMIRWFRPGSLHLKVFSGLLFAAVVVVGMYSSFELTEGIFFDGRSIVLSVAGAFGGPLTAGIAVLIAATYRIMAGGAGVYMGVSSIVISAGIGTVLFYLRQKYAWATQGMSFLAMGFLVHLAMLMSTLWLPGDQWIMVIRNIALPMLTIYPLGTFLLALLFKTQESHMDLVRQLSESELRFRQLFRDSQAVQMLISPADGRIVDVNNSAVDYYGYSHEQMCRMRINDINTLHFSEISGLIKLVEKGEKHVFILRHRLASGEIRDVEVHASSVDTDKGRLIYTIVHDITQRVKSQRELQQERILLRTVIDNLPDTVYVKDLDLRKTLANKAELEILGQTEEEVLGKTDFDIYPHDQAIKFIEDDRRVLDTGRPMINREEQIISPTTGRISWLLTSKTPLYDERGKVVGLVGIGRNITDRIQVMEELENARRNAEASNRAKSEFLANMSHEIRTPMNAILGFSEALQHRLNNPEHKKMLRSVVSSGNLLLSLLNDILDLSKIEAGRMEIHPMPVQMEQILEEIRMLFQEKARSKGLEISLEKPASFPEVLELDEVRVKQVLFNLVGNAVKFTHQGKIRITLDFEYTQTRQGLLTLCVEDTGIGIAEDQLDLIFDPFHQHHGQSNRKYGGTGLGLAITRRLVEKMNGEIRVHSTQGKGSTFTVMLPDLRVADAGTPLPRRTQLKAIPVFEHATILVVDDAPSNIEMIELILQNAGFTVMTADNGETALEIMRHTLPDLVLLDILMPGMDGYQVARIIREDPRLKDLKVIAFTAFVLEPGKIEKSGLFDDALYKPVNRNLLFDTLARYLRHTLPVSAVDQDQEAEQNQQTALLTPDSLLAGLTPEVLEMLPGQLTQIRLDLMPRWESVKDQWVLFKIEDFANKLRDKARASGLKYLEQYAETLLSHADMLDLEALKEGLQRFPVLLDQLEAELKKLD